MSGPAIWANAREFLDAYRALQAKFPDLTGDLAAAASPAPIQEEEA